VCCGLTWISTGQLATAKRVLHRSVEILSGHVDAGGLVVGLEPSCAAVFRSDAAELFPHDREVARLAGATVTLAGLLRQHTPGWRPPRLERDALVQVHCHQHAVLGDEPDLALMRDMGLRAERLDSGCCGLAGNFGFQPGHREVSEACAERVLLPRLRESTVDTVLLADGFSCRTQVHELDGGGREGVHLAEVLRAALHGDPAATGRTPEQDYARRPAAPSAAARVTALASAGSGVVAATLLARAAIRRRRARGRGHVSSPRP
jgi:Fe-S oxidoreductase